MSAASLLSSLKALFRKDRVEGDLPEELQFHLQREIEKNIATGMSPKEARYAAVRRFGGVDQVKEKCRDLRSVRFIEEMWQDLRYGLRTLSKNPSFTTISVAALALGIGANTAIFSFLDALLLRKLPVKSPDQLVTFAQYPEDEYGSYKLFSLSLFEELRKHTTSFSGVLAGNTFTASLTADERTDRIVAEVVSDNYFDVLGVHPVIGRTFTSSHSQFQASDPVVVLSYACWSSRFASDPRVVGRSISLGKTLFTVIGVVSPEFLGLNVGSASEVWTPLSMFEQVFPGLAQVYNPEFPFFRIVGRLATGVGAKQAQAEATVTLRQWNQDRTEQTSGLRPEERATRLSKSIVLSPGATGESSSLRGQYGRSMLILMSIAVLVLLIASANVACLLLGRAVVRRKEIAIRSALGGRRGRLLRQLLTESLLLSLLGGTGGTLLALYLVELLRGLLPSTTALEVELDLRVLSFTLGVSLLTGLLLGLIPALQLTKVSLRSALKDEGGAPAGRWRRLGARGGLVVVQVSLSLPLLTGAVLLLQTLKNLHNVDPGFAQENLLNASLDLGANGYTRKQTSRFYEQLLERIRAHTGVISASQSTFGVLGGYEGFTPIVLPDETNPNWTRTVRFDVVATEYFRTMSIPMLLGRDFGIRDGEGVPGVAIANQTLARLLFGTENPLGKRVGRNPGGHADIEIVGIVGDTRYGTLREEPQPILYLPLSQTPQNWTVLHIRTAADPAVLAAGLRNEIRGLDKNLPLFNVQTMTAQINNTLRQEHMVAGLFIGFSLVALALTALGLYGVLAYDVTQRTKEIGIRIALGAQYGNVLKLVVGQGMSLALVGAGIGLAGVFALTRFISSLLFGVSLADPVSFTAVSFLLLSVALLACYIPARRATKVDPMVALRCE
jgi:predicted permease